MRPGHRSRSPGPPLYVVYHVPGMPRRDEAHAVTLLARVPEIVPGATAERADAVPVDVPVFHGAVFALDDVHTPFLFDDTLTYLHSFVWHSNPS